MINKKNYFVYSLLQIIFWVNTLSYVIVIYLINTLIQYNVLTRLFYIAAILFFGLIAYFLLSFDLSTKSSKLYCEPLNFGTIILSLKKIISKGLEAAFLSAAYFTFSFGIFEGYIIPSCGFFFFFVIYYSLFVIIGFYFFNLNTKIFMFNLDFSLKSSNRKTLKLKSLYLDIKGNYAGFKLCYLFVALFWVVSFLSSKRSYLLFFILFSSLLDKAFTLAVFFGCVQLITALSLNLDFLNYMEGHFGRHLIRKLGFNNVGSILSFK